MFKKTPLPFFIFLLLLFALFSCKNKTYNNSVFWKITNENTNKTSYIIGTIHKLDTNFINFPHKELKKIANKCDVICTENLPEQVNKFFQENPMLLVLNENQKIINSLDSEHYDKLLKIADSSRYDLYDLKPYFDTIRPSRLVQFLKHDKELMQSNLFRVNNYSPETDFLNYAERNNIQVIPLENTEDIKSYTSNRHGNNVDHKESIALLKKVIDNYYNKGYIDLFERYSEQNLDLGNMEIHRDSIMLLRNKRMADKIDSIIKAKSAFILVGASHLPYEDGILKLLSKKEYFIEPQNIELRKRHN